MNKQIATAKEISCIISIISFGNVQFLYCRFMFFVGGPHLATCIFFFIFKLNQNWVLKSILARLLPHSHIVYRMRRDLNLQPLRSWAEFANHFVGSCFTKEIILIHFLLFYLQVHFVITQLPMGMRKTCNSIINFLIRQEINWPKNNLIQWEPRSQSYNRKLSEKGSNL
jgi:hypothetical protein